MIHPATQERSALLVHDYLGTHQRAAAAYAQIELGLDRLAEHDAGAEQSMRESTLDLLIAAAEEWAAGIRWQPNWPAAFYGSN